MNNITIPLLLSLTIVIAGVFAFAPIDQASTVHDQVLAGSSHLSEDAATSSGADQTITITCDATSNGCLIMEAYFQETSGSTIDLVTLTANVSGTAYEVDDDLEVSFTNSAAAVAKVGGIAIGSGDTVTLTTSGGAGAGYSIHIIAEVEGNTEIEVAIADP